MNSKKLVYIMLFCYGIFLVLSLCILKFKLVSALILTMALYFPLAPYIVSIYILKLGTKPTMSIAKTSCYSAIDILYKVNYALFLTAFIQTVILLDKDIQESILIFLSLLPLLLLNILFRTSKNICFKIMRKSLNI